MQRKSFYRTVATFLLCIIVLSILWILGCTGTTAVKQEMTPEQKQAIQDSLDREHKKRLQLLWSFAYEPYKQGDYARAKKYFRQIAELDTTGIYGKSLYQRLGDCYVRMNEPDSATSTYELGVQRNPDNPYFYNILVYLLKNDPSRIDDAIGYAEKLTEIQSDSASSFKQLGKLYIQNDDPDAAVEPLQTAVELAPDDTEAKELLNSVLSDPLEKIELLEDLAEQDPDNAKKRYDLAKAWFDYSEFDKAIVEFKKVIEAEPENVRALEYIGQSYQEVGQYTNAVGSYQKILAIKADDKKNLCNLSMSYTNLGRYTTALATANKALRLDSKYGLAFIARGFVYETAANKCSAKNKDGQDTFDDKLVYEMAYNEYEKAKADMAWKGDASRRMSYLQALIPTTSDRFMNKNKVMPESDCYSWIQ